MILILNKKYGNKNKLGLSSPKLGKAHFGLISYIILLIKLLILSRVPRIRDGNPSDVANEKL